MLHDRFGRSLLTGRAFNVSSIQVWRMKALLFALRLNELLDAGQPLYTPFPVR